MPYKFQFADCKRDAELRFEIEYKQNYDELKQQFNDSDLDKMFVNTNYNLVWKFWQKKALETDWENDLIQLQLTKANSLILNFARPW